MKDNNYNRKLSDKEWNELASILSGERNGSPSIPDKLTRITGPTTAKAWKQINSDSAAGSSEPDVEKAWEKLSSRLMDEGLLSPEQDSKKLSFNRMAVLRLAASLLIIVALGISGTRFFFPSLFVSNVTIASLADEKNKKITLPDGSLAWLNRASELSYNKKFGKTSRQVTLRGEAFFDIAHDTSKPFIIDAGKANIRVVGTSFNVITGNSLSEVEVFVKTGRVLVSVKNGSDPVIVDPGFVATTGSESTIIRKNEDKNYLSWQTGRLEYNGEKLDVVFRDLNRMFGITIIADDESILGNAWTSPIYNEDPETIIKVICVSFNLAYSKDGSEYHLFKK